MMRRFSPILALLGLTFCFGPMASADQITVALLSYDAISATSTEFDITNLTGLNAFPPAVPIATPLTISVTSLLVNLSSGSSLTLPGSDFSITDPQGDLDCTVVACNLIGDSITSAILTGTLSPTIGLKGLPPIDTGILAAFHATITPDATHCRGGTLGAGCDTAIIFATGTTTPEPGAFSLVGVGFLLIGLRLKRLRGADRRRISAGWDQF